MLIFLYCFYLDEPNLLILFPEIERAEKEKGSKLSVMCTTESGKYYPSKLNWFKENNLLPNTTNVVRHSNFLRLDFTSLKLEDAGHYKCNVTDDKDIQGKSFQLIVFGKCFQCSMHVTF